MILMESPVLMKKIYLNYYKRREEGCTNAEKKGRDKTREKSQKS